MFVLIINIIKESILYLLHRRWHESISSEWRRKWVQLQLQAWGSKRRIYPTKLPGKHSTLHGQLTVLFEDWFFQITDEVTEHNMAAVFRFNKCS
jgi:hypothetical protein